MTKSAPRDGNLNRPRLMLITQWFDPEPTFKGLVFARGLQRRGFDVEVVTGFPNYPGGKVYGGYKIRAIQREVIDEINITRLPLYPSHDKSSIGRVLNYVSFGISCIVYLALFARRSDVTYVYHPPLTVGFAAALAKLVRRFPMVIDIQDMWPDTLRATGMINNNFLLAIVSRFCNWVYRRADHIVVLSPGFRHLLIGRGVAEDKISIIYNWADEKSIANVGNKRPVMMQESGKFRLLFAGNMGQAQGLDNVLEAAIIVANVKPAVEFCFLGGGLALPHLKKRCVAEGISNVRFLPQVPMHEVGDYLAAADCLLVHLRSDPLFTITIPSKTQAYLAAGKPVIMNVPGDAATLIRDSKSGLIIPAEDPQSLADAVIEMANKNLQELSAMGSAGREFYYENLSLEKGLNSFVKVFMHSIDGRT